MGVTGRNLARYHAALGRPGDRRRQLVGYLMKPVMSPAAAGRLGVGWIIPGRRPGRGGPRPRQYYVLVADSTSHSLPARGRRSAGSSPHGRKNLPLRSSVNRSIREQSPVPSWQLLLLTPSTAAWSLERAIPRRRLTSTAEGGVFANQSALGLDDVSRPGRSCSRRQFFACTDGLLEAFDATRRANPGRLASVPPAGRLQVGGRMEGEAFLETPPRDVAPHAGGCAEALRGISPEAQV